MSSASFWTQIRWRLGGSDAVMNRINDLIQKQINANSEAQDVTVEEILNPIITLPSKVVMRDNLFQTKVRSITQGQIAYFPVDPDLDTMRLWVLNEHGGRYLTDHSFMQNTIQLNGTDQTKLVWGNDDDGVSGDPIVNRLIDDQYIRVEDNPNVQIKDITATAEGISIFLRLYIEYARSELKFGKPNVLFSKIDNEQVDYGYAAYLTDDGAISFFVRHNRIEYSVATPPHSIIWTNINLPDYSESDYTPADYYTIANVPAIPDPAPYVDLCFTYNFTTHQMQIIRSDFTDGAGIIIASSSTSPNGVDGPLSANLKGWWKITEGGPVGATPAVNTISDLSTNALHATAVNPLWETETSNILFSSANNAYVPIVTNTSGKQINNLNTAFTFSAWARIDNAQGGYAGIVSNLNGRSDGNKILVRNNGANTEVLWRGHNGTNPVDTLATKTATNLVGDDLWHHYAVTYDKIQVRIYLDGVLLFSEPQSYTVASGTANMTLGWGSTNTTLYHLTGSMQDVLLYNVKLTDAQLVEIYEQGRPVSYFPKWRADPPTEPPPPSPNTNPFQSVYNCPPPTNVAERDMVRLHQITAVGMTRHYNVSQGDQQVGQHVDEDGAYYNNDPTYIAGSTGVVASYYDSPIPSDHVVSYLRLDSTLFGGEIIKASSPLIGKTISKLNVYGCDMNAVDAPATGNIVCKIKKAAGGADLVSNVIQADDLIDNAGPTSPATGWQIMVFTFPTNSYLLAAGDKIQFEYAGGTVEGEPEPEPEPTPTAQYLVSPASNDQVADLIPNGFFMAKQKVKTGSSLIGKVITQITFHVGRTNVSNSTGPRVVFGIGRPDGEPIELASISPNSFPVTTFGNVSGMQAFSSPASTTNTHVMRANDYVFLTMADGPWAAGSAINIRLTVSDKAGGSNFVWSTDGVRDPDQEYAAYDMVGQFQGYAPGGGGGVPVGEPMKVAIARSTANLANFANQYDAPYPLTSTIQERSTQDLYMTVFVTSSTTANHLYTKLYVTGGPKYAAIYVNSNAAGLFGKKVTRATFRISRVGTPTGTLFCKIRKGDGTTITLGLNGAAGAGLNVAGIDPNTNPATVYSFENRANGEDTGYALVAGDRIMLELTGTSTSANYIQVARTHTVSTMDNVYMQTSVDNVTWSPSTASQDDVVGIIYIGGFDTPLVTPYHTLGWQNSRVSQKVISTQSDPGNIHNVKITQVKVWLRRVGLATGLITCCIRDSAGALVTNINTVEASSVSDTNFVLYTFPNLNNTIPLKQNDRVSIEYSGGDINKHIQINTNLLNTYPFGGLELYTGTYALKQNHDLAGEMSSGGGATDPLARTRVAERVGTTDSALKLKKISRVRVWLRKQSNPLGNVVIRIRDSNSNPVALIGNIDAETQVTSDPTEFTVTSSPIAVYPLQVNDFVSVEYNGGDDSNFVEVMTTKTTDGFDGVVKTYLAKYDDVSWVNNTAIDLVGRMDQGGDTFTPSQEDVIIPPPVYTKDLCVLAGGPPWSYIDHQTSTLTHAPSQLFTNAVMPDFRFYRRVLTVQELINIFTNRVDRADIAYGEVTRIGFFAISEQ